MNKTLYNLKINLACIVFCLLFASSARSGVVLQPVSAAYTDNQFSQLPDFTRNQSGLSSGYTNGVTDFDNYTISNPSHTNSSTNSFLSNPGSNRTGNLDFDLGGTFSIDKLALWNLGGSVNSLEDFDVYTADNALFTGATKVNASTLTALQTTTVQVFDLTPSTASHIRIDFSDSNPNYGGNGDGTGVGEVAFSSSAAIPEPSSYLLFGTAISGLLGIGWLRRKRIRNGTEPKSELQTEVKSSD